MKPTVGRIVHVLVDPKQNNGSDVAAAVITRVWSDTCTTAHPCRPKARTGRTGSRPGRCTSPARQLRKLMPRGWPSSAWATHSRCPPGSGLRGSSISQATARHFLTHRDRFRRILCAGAGEGQPASS